jgi:raffinose/stachyose/melibiose transport system permease protein
MTTSTVPAHHRQPKSRRTRRDTFSGGTPLFWLLAFVAVAVSLGPVLIAMLGGFRTNAQLAESPGGWPDPWVFFNYADAITNPDFWRFTVNSLVIGAVTTLLVVVFGMMAAYPLARYRFWGREALFMVFVAGLLFPATVAAIPLFILVSQNLGLSNTWWGIALPQAAFALPLSVVILRPFIIALPNEIEEAAMIDGSSRIGIFWRIVVPLSWPAMVTVGVVAFVHSWNAYLLPLLLLQRENRTLPLGVADYSTEYSADVAGVFAFTSLAMVPALVLFLVFQKRIVSGLQGAVKG